MRRVCFFLAVLLSASLFLSGCEREICLQATLLSFQDAYGLVGTVYATGVKEGEEGYMEEGMLDTLYGEYRPSFEEIAVFLSADIDEVRECGMFLVSGGEQTNAAILLAKERISVVEGVFSGAESGILRYRDAVVYYILPDGERAHRLFDRLL